MSPLTNEEKRFLLRLARSSVEAAVRRRRMELPGPVPPALEFPAGAFVTLRKRRLLRGCVGFVQPVRPLYRTVAESAAAAALGDPRFPPVGPWELPELGQEVSVLSLASQISPEQIRVGTHGLIISQDQFLGLLLPQVAAEHDWSRERFLEETCRKAGLPLNAWRKGAKIEAFTAEVFGEEILGMEAGQDSRAATPPRPHPREKFPPG